MNKKGFIDFDDVNPVAVAFALVTGFVAFFVSGFYPSGFFWRIASGLATVFVSFFMFNRMFS